MSYFDQEQPIDYTNKYNENIGTISPKSRHHSKLDNSHLTSYHSKNLYTSSKADTTDSYNRSTFGHSQFINQTPLVNNMAFSNNLYSTGLSNQENYNYQMNQSSNHLNKNLSQDCLDSGEFTYLYETADTLIVYQTEDTPICFSNDSPISSLSCSSLDCLQPTNFNTNSNNLNNGDSLLEYNMEGTPICFSYDSPLSPLSLNFSSDGDLSPPTLDFINQRIDRAKENRIRNNDQDITSMVSMMSIENKALSTRSSTDRLSKKSEFKFGRLNNDEDGQSADGFSLLGFNTPRSQRAFDQQHQSNNEINEQTKFSDQTKAVNQSDNQSNDQSMNQEPLNRTRSVEQQMDEETMNSVVDFEDGFDESDNEKFHLDECIKFGRLASRTNGDQSMHSSAVQQSIQQPQNSIFQFNNRLNVSQTGKQENITYQKPSHLITFGQEESTSNQQKPMKQVKNIVKMDEATTITNFSTKYASRSQYKIDGEEQLRTGSVVFGPVCTLPPNSPYHQSVSPDRTPKSCHVESSPGQVKQRGLKKIFGIWKKKN